MKVLIVDDEIEICKRLKSTLEKQNCRVEYTNSPVDIMEKLYNAKTEGEAYDLILLDLRMPKVSGFEVLKQIRDSKLDLDVIVITAYGDQDKAIEAIQLGAIDYLRKPISLEELHTAIFRVRQKKMNKEKAMHSGSV
jgi:DNA-binding NtrC family response regulator